GVNISSRASSQVLSADGGRDRAILVDRDIDDALRVSAAAPGADAAAHAALERAFAAAGSLISPFPADFLCATVELAMPILIRDVLLAELDWVHPQLVCQFIHQRFHREGSLRMSRRAQGDGRILVRIERL